MKKFIIKCCSFFLLLACVLGAGLAIPARWIYESIHFATLDKHEMLRQDVAKPRLLLVGGSNLTFGVLSPMLQEEFGVEVINTAVHAGYGLKYIMDDISPFIRDGDYLLLVPEYAHFYGDLLDGSSVLLDGLEVVPSNFWRLDRAQLMVVASAAPKYSLQKMELALRATQIRRQQEKLPYRRSGLNSRGDAVAHWELNQVPLKPVEMSGPFNEETLQRISEFAELVERRGGTLAISYPCLNRSSFLVNEQAIMDVDAELKSLDVAVLGTAARYSFVDELHFDTHYHLIKEGQVLRTKLLIEDLRESGFLQWIEQHR